MVWEEAECFLFTSYMFLRTLEIRNCFLAVKGKHGLD